MPCPLAITVDLQHWYCRIILPALFVHPHSYTNIKSLTTELSGSPKNSSLITNNKQADSEVHYTISQDSHPVSNYSQNKLSIIDLKIWHSVHSFEHCTELISCKFALVMNQYVTLRTNVVSKDPSTSFREPICPLYHPLDIFYRNTSICFNVEGYLTDVKIDVH